MDINPAMWLNTVRAVPAVGISFVSNFDTPASILTRLRPLLRKWREEQASLKFGIDKDFTVKVERPDGVELQVTHDRLVAKFYYLTTFVERGLRQPTVKYQCDPMPFEQIAALLLDVVGEVLAELYKDGNRAITRVGVVADGNFDPDALAPGFEKLLHHVSQPWEKGLVSANFTMLARLSEEGHWVDRCHHVLNSSGDDDAVVAFKLDWQRAYNEPLIQSAKQVRQSFSEIVDLALEYFGRFGIGDLNYANCK